MQNSPEIDAVIKGFRRSETIRNLDERSALKIALALAGFNPELFDKLYEATRTQNSVPASTLVLSPVPLTSGSGHAKT